MSEASAQRTVVQIVNNSVIIIILHGVQLLPRTSQRAWRRAAKSRAIRNRLPLCYFETVATVSRNKCALDVRPCRDCLRAAEKSRKEAAKRATIKRADDLQHDAAEAGQCALPIGADHTPTVRVFPADDDASGMPKAGGRFKTHFGHRPTNFVRCRSGNRTGRDRQLRVESVSAVRADGQGSG